MKLQSVNAFSGTLFGGNPAGVVVVPADGAFPSDGIMRLVAAELKHSETAFVKSLGNARFHTRYFTPVAEVPLCGHATIAAAHALAAFGYVGAHQALVFDTGAGEMRIDVADGVIMMDMAPPQIVQSIESLPMLEEIYRVMGLPVPTLDKATTPSQDALIPTVVSTGLPDLVLPLADLGQLANMKPDFAALSKLCTQLDAVGVHAFAIDARSGWVHARNFAPLLGIDEEAATGTGNGALGYYLHRHGLLKTGQMLHVLQGEAMGRPSEVMVQVLEEAGQTKVRVGGRAVTLITGELHLPAAVRTPEVHPDR